MIVAGLETPNFSFVALGATSTEARAALEQGWERHQRQTGATAGWADLEDSVIVHDLEPGQVVRNGVPL